MCLTHFVAMMGFAVVGMPIRYDVGLTAAAYLAGRRSDEAVPAAAAPPAPGQPDGRRMPSVASNWTFRDRSGQ